MASLWLAVNPEASTARSGAQTMHSAATDWMKSPDNPVLQPGEQVSNRGTARLCLITPMTGPMSTLKHIQPSPSRLKVPMEQSTMQLAIRIMTDTCVLGNLSGNQSIQTSNRVILFSRPMLMKQQLSIPVGQIAGTARCRCRYGRQARSMRHGLRRILSLCAVKSGRKMDLCLSRSRM